MIHGRYRDAMGDGTLIHRASSASVQSILQAVTFLIFFISVLIGCHTYASIKSNACVNQHILEAIELNKQRKPLYIHITQGKSDSISNLLIASEYLSLLYGKLLDSYAFPYQQAGIPILCDEIISMDHTPSFLPTVPLTRDEQHYIYHPPETERYTQVMKDVYQATHNFSLLAQITENELEKIKHLPHFHCMYRHLLESILRACKLAPNHIENAWSLHIDPQGVMQLSWLFISFQLSSFELGMALDIRAFPLQKAGIPIICRDVPPIPPDDS